MRRLTSSADGSRVGAERRHARGMKAELRVFGLLQLIVLGLNDDVFRLNDGVDEVLKDSPVRRGRGEVCGRRWLLHQLALSAELPLLLPLILPLYSTKTERQVRRVR
jgi:hypothetical protein